MRKAAVLAAALAAACGRGRAPGVNPGDSVALGYELSSEGRVVESRMAEPVALVQGAGQVPADVDAALLGMEPGREKTVTLPPERAFGPRRADLVQTMALKDFGPVARDLKVGRKVEGFRDGKAQTALVTALGKDAATLDFNHPLAGKAVTYRLRVVSDAPAR